MDLSEIRELIRILESSGLSEIEIEEDGSRIRLSKASAQAPPPQTMPILLGHSGETAFASQAYHMGQEAQPPAAPEEKTEAPEEEDEGLVTIDSPMVGTFYRSPAPSEPPFVQPGDTVEVDETVCIVEAMKIMNEVVAKFPAVIEKILVENGEPVEFGQPLFSVRPLD